MPPVTAAHLSLFYLGAPVVLFWLAYVSGWLGWIVAAALCLVTALAWHRTNPSEEEGACHAWMVPLALAALVLWLAGFPGGPFPWDWFKHWALIGILIEEDWPVRVTLDGQELGLRFYMAAYLIPSAIGKTGLSAEPWLPVALWFGTGYWLLFRIASEGCVARRGIAVLLLPMIFLLMGGADLAVERGARALAGEAFRPLFGFHEEWWAAHWLRVPVQYTSVLSSLVWVPHQSIATGIVALLLVSDPRKVPWAGVLGYVFLALWSPFGMIGLTPLVIWRLFESRDQWVRDRLVWIAAGVLVVAPLLVAVYLMGGAQRMALLPSSPIDLLRRVLFNPLFLVVELLPFALILRRRMLRDGTLAVCTLTLIALPFFSGEPLDFAMRAAAGPLVVLAWQSARELTSLPVLKPGARVAALVGLVMCASTAIGEAVFLGQAGHAHRALPEGDPLHERLYTTFVHSDRVSLEQFFDTCGWEYVPQYFSARPAFVSE